MSITPDSIKAETAQVLTEFQEQVQLGKQHLLVIGCSTSEVSGNRIGTSGTFEIAEALFSELQKFQSQTEVSLAVQ